MAKIQLISETHDLNRRKPGFALLKISGWNYSPQETQLSIQRSEDEKFLGTDGQWEPSPVWHFISNMNAAADNVLEGDVGPAMVDPIVNSPNNSYRVTLKTDAETETRTMRVDGDIFPSNASGSTPDSLTIGNGFILDDSAVGTAVEEEVETVNESPELPESELEPEPDNASDTIASVSESKPGFIARNKVLIIVLFLILLSLAAAAALWYFKVPPFTADQKPFADSQQDNQLPEQPIVRPPLEPLEVASAPAQTQLSDMELLQQFLATKPSTDEILAMAQEWKNTGHCRAMLKMMVYSGHKSNDSIIALEYAKMHDPNLFKAGGCIEEGDKDTAVYWYQKSIDAGNTEAKQYLEKL